MKFSDVVEQARTLLQRAGKITYRTLKREFALDEETLADLKEELLFSDPQVKEESERGLVWVGDREFRAGAWTRCRHDRSRQTRRPDHGGRRSARERRKRAQGEARHRQRPSLRPESIDQSRRPPNSVVFLKAGDP